MKPGHLTNSTGFFVGLRFHRYHRFSFFFGNVQSFSGFMESLTFKRGDFGTAHPCQIGRSKLLRWDEGYFWNPTTEFFFGKYMINKLLYHPENQATVPFQKDIPFSNRWFSGDMLNFQGVGSPPRPLIVKELECQVEHLKKCQMRHETKKITPERVNTFCVHICHPALIPGFTRMVQL